MRTELDKHLLGFWLQVGFVEGLVTEGVVFSELAHAYAYIFSNNKESAFLLCNGIPVRLSYIEDLPVWLPTLIQNLDVIQTHSELSDHTMMMKTKNIEAEWVFNCKNNLLSISVIWRLVNGDYQESLNGFSTTTVSKDKFLNEWLMLLRQCQQCMKDAKAVLVGRASLQQNLLNTVESRINGFGRFYSSLKK